jgi:hypothetical protein
VHGKWKRGNIGSYPSTAVRTQSHTALYCNAINWQIVVVVVDDMAQKKKVVRAAIKIYSYEHQTLHKSQFSKLPTTGFFLVFLLAQRWRRDWRDCRAPICLFHSLSLFLFLVTQITPHDNRTDGVCTQRSVVWVNALFFWQISKLILSQIEKTLCSDS